MFALRLEVLAMALGNVGLDLIGVGGVVLFRKVTLLSSNLIKQDANTAKANSGHYPIEPYISASSLRLILLIGIAFFYWMISHSIVDMFMNERWRERRLKWLLGGIVSGLLVAVLLARYTSHIVVSILPFSVILNLYIADKYDPQPLEPMDRGGVETADEIGY